MAGLAALGLVGSGLALALGPGRGLFQSQPQGSPSPSGSWAGTAVPTSASSGVPGPPTTDSTPAATQSSADRKTGAPAIQEAVEAYRRTLGGGDPYAVRMAFYPSPDPDQQARAIATFPSRASPAVADEYTYSDGVVRDPTPPVIRVTDVAARQWRFSAVAWPKMAAMLQTTEQVCRAAMNKAKLPDKPDQFGERAGISHVIVERDLTFYDGKVVVRVYFDGGAYWSGGYVPFYANGTKISDRYCTTS